MPPSSALSPYVGSQGGLGVSISSGLVYANSSIYGVISTFLPCQPNTINFGFLTLSPTIALVVNQSGFPSQNVLPIFIAQSGQKEIKNLVDYRPDWFLQGGTGGGGGGSPTVAAVTLTGQTTSIGSTPLLSSAPAGMYAVYVDVIVTTTSAAGRIATTVSWNNGTTNGALTSSSFSLTVQGEQSALLGNFYCGAGQTISYSTSLTGVTGNPQYQLALRLVYLG